MLSMYADVRVGADLWLDCLCLHSQGSIIGVELRSLWLQGATEASSWSGKPHAGLDCWSPNVNINRDPRYCTILHACHDPRTSSGVVGSSSIAHVVCSNSNALGVCTRSL